MIEASRQTVSARSGEWAVAAPCFLGLFLAMREQLVDFLGERTNFRREIFTDARSLARSDCRNILANPP